jgi:hypothetical protein
MTLIERVPSLKKISPVDQPKVTPPPKQKTYYTPPPKSPPRATRSTSWLPRFSLKSILWFIGLSFLLSYGSTLFSHQNSSSVDPQPTSAQPVQGSLDTTPVISSASRDNFFDTPVVKNSTATAPTTPTASGTPPVSLATGTVLHENSAFFNGYNGQSELTIENGSGYDALVKLVYSNHSVYTVYIRQNDTYSIKNITDGTYTVLFAFGTNWDKINSVFLKDQSFSKFDDTFDFTTTTTRYSHYTITLNPVLGGTASTSSVNSSQFNNY